MSAQESMGFDMIYDCEVLAELPQPKLMPPFYYPGATRSGGSDGIMIQVMPSGADPWIGVFAYGVVTPKGVSGVFTTPNADLLCVVARGRGFLVSASDPQKYEEIDFGPILDVRLVPKHGILVFANFTELLAYGKEGLRWRSARLAWDSMKITEVTEDSIRGEFWDIQSEDVATFSVNPATGVNEGGVLFPG